MSALAPTSIARKAYEQFGIFKCSDALIRHGISSPAEQLATWSGSSSLIWQRQTQFPSGVKTTLTAGYKNSWLQHLNAFEGSGEPIMLYG